ncbi:MAG: nucleoside triphosphate pyrophosphatase [Thermoleophilaceae bacterium]|nr:nucleoside triphosphate pyrophosphatase [Thermoleophilaceae bacterium]
MSPRLTLASRSPQRREILEQLGIDFVVAEPHEVEEAGEGDPRWLVEENALRKARSVSGDLVVGVDTDVALDGRVFGKPASRDDAEAMLLALSGRTHEVWSGIALLDAGAERTSVACTKVRFARIERPLLDWYLAAEEWRGRAGGYAIQGRGAALVESIDGDFWNVVGLPVPDLLELAPELFT